VIKSYRNAKTRRVHDTGHARGFRGLDGARAVRVLNLLNNAATLDELPRLAAYRLHKLSRGRKGQWSMTVNLPWVVCFTPAKGGGWADVEIVDYH
jgi:proteic killer suppression protein